MTVGEEKLLLGNILKSTSNCIGQILSKKCLLHDTVKEEIDG